jgi:hypothetical protein
LHIDLEMRLLPYLLGCLPPRRLGRLLSNLNEVSSPMLIDRLLSDFIGHLLAHFLGRLIADC